MTPRLLIVDDNEMLLRTQAAYLRRRGWRVETAVSGAAARRWLQREIPDVALFDLRLPDVNGLDLLGNLRWRGFRLPVVVMSAERRDDWLLRALECGAAAYLCKPFALATLARVLDCARAGMRCIPSCPIPERCTAPQAHILSALIPGSSTSSSGGSHSVTGITSVRFRG